MLYALCSVLFALLCALMLYALCSMVYGLCSMLYTPVLYARYALCSSLCSTFYAPCSTLHKLYALCTYALCYTRMLYALRPYSPQKLFSSKNQKCKYPMKRNTVYHR